MKKSRIAYIVPDDAGKPSATLAQVLADASFEAFRGLNYSTEPRAGKGRRKVRVTVTVEAVE